MKMYISAVTASALSLVFVLIVSGCGKKAETVSTVVRPDNVVIITLDTTRADYLGCYGNTVVKTPNLDAFAAGAVLFTNCYSTCNSTLPSHTSMFTSLYPKDHGVVHNKIAVPDLPSLMPRVFKAAGYRTAAFTSGGHLSPASGINQGYDDFFSPEGFERRSADTNEIVRKWLTVLGYSSGGTRGVFAWFHYFDPHGGYEPPAPYDTMYKLISDERVRNTGSYVVDNKVMQDYGKEEYDPEIARDLYRGEITFMDSEFGRLAGMLKAAGMYDNTLVVVVADHGESLGDHGIYWNHAGLYDATVHVPMMIKPAGKFTPGVRGQLASSTDIYPTVMEMAGIKPGPVSHGASLTGIIGDPSAPEIHDEVYFQSIHEGQLGVKTLKDTYIRNVMTGAAGTNRKMITGPAGQAELYDNAADPGQTRNLIADAADRAAPLEAKAMAFINDRATRTDAAEITDKGQLKKLKALGYLQ